MNAVVSQVEKFSLTPKSLTEAMQFADVLAKSSIVPKDYQNNPGNVIVAIQWGQEIGLDPLQAMQSIAVINGRPAIFGDAMIALVRASGLLESIEETPTDDGCTCTVKRRGEAQVTREFTIEDAKKAGLFGKSGPWTQYPKRMLQMRARAFALRDVFPDVLRGVHIAEEAQDAPIEKDVTPAPSAASPAESVRKAIAQQKSEPMIDPAAVTQAIASAESLEQLEVAAKLAAQLSGPDRIAARAAFKARKEELTPKPEPTGEISPAVADWLAHIDDIGTLSDIGRASKDIHADDRITETEREQVMAALRLRQQGIKG